MKDNGKYTDDKCENINESFERKEVIKTEIINIVASTMFQWV